MLRTIPERSGKHEKVIFISAELKVLRKVRNSFSILRSFFIEAN